jgi:hypothetical protein
MRAPPKKKKKKTNLTRIITFSKKSSEIVNNFRNGFAYLDFPSLKYSLPYPKE